MAYQSCDGTELPYPIIADPTRSIATELGMIDPDEKTETGMPLTCRAVRALLIIHIWFDKANVKI